jgi:hypothetical protein
MNESLDTARACRLQHVKRSLNVSLYDIAWALVRIGNTNLRAKVEHRPAAGNEVSDCITIAKVSSNYFDLIAQLNVDGVKRAPITTRIVVHQRPRICPSPYQGFYQMAADEATSARDPNPLTGPA